mmetsp:Transcript_85814/g.135528  ORF Transcript_85814/g.135528 Transcript_85814/m.135528 type:complete len:154 (-) Transcript_85814:12-473(-)
MGVLAAVSNAAQLHLTPVTAIDAHAVHFVKPKDATSFAANATTVDTVRMSLECPCSIDPRRGDWSEGSGSGATNMPVLECFCKPSAATAGGGQPEPPAMAAMHPIFGLFAPPPTLFATRTVEQPRESFRSCDQQKYIRRVRNARWVDAMDRFL